MATAKLIPPGASKPRVRLFVAYNDRNEEATRGTLSEIMDFIEDRDGDPDDFVFFRADEPIKVKFVKKLVLEEDDGNS